MNASWSELFLTNTLLYVTFLIFYSGVAVHSLEYYVAKSKVSRQTLYTFISNLKQPVSWFFVGQCPLFKLFYRHGKNKRMEIIDYLQDVSLRYAQFQRRAIIVVASTAGLADLVGALRVILGPNPDIPTILQYLFWIIINLGMLRACMRFGSELAEANPQG